MSITQILKVMLLNQQTIMSALRQVLEDGRKPGENRDDQRSVIDSALQMTQKMIYELK